MVDSDPGDAVQCFPPRGPGIDRAGLSRVVASRATGSSRAWRILARTAPTRAGQTCPISSFSANSKRWMQCYIETYDHGYVGHFHVRLTNFTRTRLAFEIVRKRNTYVEVSCSLDAVEFKELQRIVNIIFDQHG
jgi:hypothetical protein